MSGVGDTLVMFERDSDLESKVSRRYTYKKLGDDRFSLLLEFSLDRGKSWQPRNETFYTRGF